MASSSRDHTLLVHSGDLRVSRTSRSTVILILPKTSLPADYETPYYRPEANGGGADSRETNNYESIILNNRPGQWRSSDTIENKNLFPEGSLLRREIQSSVSLDDSNDSTVTVSGTESNGGFGYEQLKLADAIIKQSKCQQLYIKILLIVNAILFVNVIVFGAAFASLYLHIPGTVQQKAPLESPTQNLIQCDEFVVMIRKTRLAEIKTNSSESCSESAEGILNVLNHHVEELISSEISRGIKLLTDMFHSNYNQSEAQKMSRPVFAHIIADRSNQHVESAGSFATPLPMKIPRFYTGANRRIWWKGIEILNSRLFVPENGLYLVYSQVQYSQTSGSHATVTDDKLHSAPSTTQILTHRVCRYDVNLPNDHEELLMKTSLSRYAMENGEASFQHSTYLSGAFFLTSGDQIYVKVSDKTLVDLEEITTYFGAFKLADG